MKKLFALALASSFAAVGIVQAAELQSGPQTGTKVGAFQVTKVAGAPNDGVKEGTELCYRCKLGDRPVVMVFSRKADDKLANLTKSLEGVVAKNSDKKMASFVNLLGKNSDELTKQAKELATNNKLENVAVVVPVETATGPADYKISDQAETTVLIYKDGTVAVNRAYGPGALTDDAIKQIVADTGKILN